MGSELKRKVGVGRPSYYKAFPFYTKEYCFASALSPHHQREAQIPDKTPDAHSIDNHSKLLKTRVGTLFK